jgi:hypothetical protein
MIQKLVGGERFQIDTYWALGVRETGKAMRGVGLVVVWPCSRLLEIGGFNPNLGFLCETMLVVVRGNRGASCKLRVLR